MQTGTISVGRAPLFRRSAHLLWALGLISLLLGLIVFSSSSAGAASGGPRYQLSLGDSLTAGVGASSVSVDYANLVRDHESALVPGLRVENLACPGATTTTMLTGGGFCTYQQGSQLAAAEAFLRSHPGRIPYITLDIGINNVDLCPSGPSINEQCVADGVASAKSDLPQIISGLQTAAPGVPIFGANSYDPFLAGDPNASGEGNDPYLSYSSLGTGFTSQSLSMIGSLNRVIAGVYHDNGVNLVDVANEFQTHDSAQTGSFQGTEQPQNVSDICAWTHMCDASALTIHFNEIGEFEVAELFATAIERNVAS